MTKQYSNFAVADLAAKQQSIRNPALGYYVSWVEDNCYKITCFEDFPYQEYWQAGIKFNPQDDDTGA